MTLRNASGKFSLPFGRKADGPSSPTQASSRQASGTFPASSGVVGVSGDGDSDSHVSPGGGAGFDGLGRKIGKSIAHTSLLPSLGNQELRALQDIIASEKGVLTMAERLAQETQTAASKLAPWGKEEGPDLQDILGHSSTLLSSLATALHVFVSHQAGLRVSFKRIREREEALDDIRRRRKNTGSRAESAEKKLAKMGPENKQLPGQTELLERLRSEMRSLDNDIITEEAKLGDYKRQVVKEALSLKFGGLEELGEKMCIIGELGKLLLEEVPLEETPVGYPRATYTAYDRTEHTVNEATKCLATVQFHAGSAAPKPPGLPHLETADSLRPPSLPRHGRSISDAEEFAHYPGNLASPPGTSHEAYGLDHNPYTDPSSPTFGSAPRSATQLMNATHTEFGGTHAHPPGTVVWQGPTEEALAGADYQGPGAASATAAYVNGHGREAAAVGDDEADRAGPSYEYEQQAEIDAEHAKEEAAWRAEQAHGDVPAPAGDIHASVIHDPGLAGSASVAPAHPGLIPPTEGAEGVQGEAGPSSPWEPLNVKREKTPEPRSLSDAPVPSFAPPAGPPPSHTLGVPGVYTPGLPPPLTSALSSSSVLRGASAAPAPAPAAGFDSSQAYDAYDAIEDAPESHELEIPPRVSGETEPASNGYYTPREGSTPVPTIPAPSAATTEATPRAALSPLSPASASVAASTFPLPGDRDTVSSPASVATFGPNSGPGGVGVGGAGGGATVGKMSAAAFRRGVKPRGSTESGDYAALASPIPRAGTASPSPSLGNGSPSTNSGHQIRRLPVPPLNPEEGAGVGGAEGEGMDPPPVYAEESLR